MIGYILLCILVADFITGLGHWLEDTYGLPTWPIIGKEVIQPNIEHHLHPSVIGCMTSIVSRNYQTVVPAILISLVLAWFGCWYTILILMLVSFGNEVHSWTHRKNNPAWITFLQDACIVQTPRNHLKHHHEPYDKYFCVLTNFTNEVLERINFWKTLERIILVVFKVEPKRMTEARSWV